MFKSIERISRALMVLAILFIAGSTTTYSQTAVTLPTVTGQPGDAVTLDINIGSITGEGVIGFNFSFNYDPTVISISGFEREGTLSAGFSNVLDNIDSDAGKYTVGGFNISAVEGSGTFIKINAEIIGNGVSPLTWTKAEVNKEDDTILNVVTTDGAVNSPARDIDVFYADKIVPVGDDFTLPINVMDLVADDEVVSVEMNVSYDPAVVSITNVVAGDVTSGASVVGNTGTAGVVRIAIASGSALSGDGSLVVLEGTAVAGGNAAISVDAVTFNDGAPVAVITNGMLTSTETVVTVSDFTAVKGRTVMIPVTTDGYDGTIATFGFEVVYDAAAIEVVGVNTAGGLAESFTAVYNPENNKVSAASPTGFTGDGTLLFIEATMLETGSSNVTLTNFSYSTFDEDELVVGVIGGDLTVVENSAPVFTASLGNSTLTNEETLSFTYVATDANDDKLTYSTDGTVDGAEIDPETGVFTWSPTESQVGVFTINVSVTDGDTLISTAADVTVVASTVDVTFTVYLDLASNFNPANDDLYLSGSFVGGGGWDQPGTNDSAKLSPVDGNELLYSITYPVLKGDHAYKYFSVPKGGASWDNGEWPGDPNRTITVDGDMEVSDLYGVKPGETISIMTARSLQSGAPVSVPGVSTTPDFGFNSAQFYMQDSEAGVKVFHRGVGGGNTDTPYAEGQSLVMEGTMGAFNDEVQLAATGYTVVSEGNGLPDPVIFPSYDEWTVDSKYQGMRVTLTNMVLPEASGWPVDKITSGSGVTTQIEGTLEQLLGTYDVRIDRDESYFDESARPTGNFNLTGVMGRFRSNPQIFPFFADELGEATSSEVQEGMPTEFTLSQNYPNPFNPSTQITFALPEASDVRLEVYNVMGQRVASLVNSKLNAGYHTVEFDATNLSSGTYFYRIAAGSFMQTKSMMLIK